MQSVYVKPRPGGRVRMPDRNFQPMAPEGAWVERRDFYERLIICGDLIICDPPQAPPPIDTKSDEPPQGGSTV